MPASGFTNHEENGFFIGSEAFTKSPEELEKTIIHELFRLNTQSGNMGAGETRSATDEAVNAADKLYKYLEQ